MMNLKNTRIGIIGMGVVGQATARSLIEHVGEIAAYDIDPRKRTVPEVKDAIIDTDITFICLPTPERNDRYGLDISVVDGFFESIPAEHRKRYFVLKSTMPIGSTRRLALQTESTLSYHFPNLVHSPEFLTARCAIVDAHIPSRNIIGMPAGYVSGCSTFLTYFYEARFPNAPIHKMTSDESEAVKIFLNGFFATKVAYFNQIYELTASRKMNWGRILNGMLSDGRIAHAHTQVPGPDGGLGFGGTCLPKDLSQLIEHLSHSQCPGDLAQAVAAWRQDRITNQGRR